MRRSCASVDFDAHAAVGANTALSAAQQSVNLAAINSMSMSPTKILDQLSDSSPKNSPRTFGTPSSPRQQQQQQRGSTFAPSRSMSHVGNLPVGMQQAMAGIHMSKVPKFEDWLICLEATRHNEHDFSG